MTTNAFQAHVAANVQMARESGLTQAKADFNAKMIEKYGHCNRGARNVEERIEAEALARCSVLADLPAKRAEVLAETQHVGQ